MPTISNDYSSTHDQAKDEEASSQASASIPTSPYYQGYLTCTHAAHGLTAEDYDDFGSDFSSDFDTPPPATSPTCSTAAYETPPPSPTILRDDSEEDLSIPNSGPCPRPGAGRTISNPAVVLLISVAAFVLGIAIGRGSWHATVVHKVGQQLPLLEEIRDMVNTWAQLPVVLFGDSDGEGDGSDYTEYIVGAGRGGMQDVEDKHQQDYNNKKTGYGGQYIYQNRRPPTETPPSTADKSFTDLQTPAFAPLESMLFTNLYNLLTDVCNVLQDLDITTITITSLCHLAITSSHHAEQLWTRLYDTYLSPVRTPFEPASEMLRRVATQLSFLDADAPIFAGPDASELARRQKELLGGLFGFFGRGLGSNRTQAMQLPGWYSFMGLPGIGSEIQCVSLDAFCNRGVMGWVDVQGDKTKTKTALFAHPLCALLVERDGVTSRLLPRDVLGGGGGLDNDNSSNSNKAFHAPLIEQAHLLVQVIASHSDTTHAMTNSQQQQQQQPPPPIFTGTLPTFRDSWTPNALKFDSESRRLRYHETILLGTLRHTLLVHQAAHLILDFAHDTAAAAAGASTTITGRKWPPRAYQNRHDPRSKTNNDSNKKNSGGDGSAQWLWSPWTSSSSMSDSNSNDNNDNNDNDDFPALRALQAIVAKDLDALVLRASKASSVLALSCEQRMAFLGHVAGLRNGYGWFEWGYSYSHHHNGGQHNQNKEEYATRDSVLKSGSGFKSQSTSQSGFNSKFTSKSAIIEMHHHILPSQKEQIRQLEQMAAFVDAQEWETKVQCAERLRAAGGVRRSVERALAKFAGLDANDDNYNDDDNAAALRQHYSDSQGYIFWWHMDVYDSIAIKQRVRKQEQDHLRQTDPGLAALLAKYEIQRAQDGGGRYYQDNNEDDGGDNDDNDFIDSQIRLGQGSGSSFFADEHWNALNELLRALEDGHNHGSSSGSGSRDLPDYYTVLGVPRTASTDEIRSAGRRLTRELHPDKVKAKGRKKDAAVSPNNKEKEEEVNAAYILVQEARSILEDTEARAAYDAGDWVGLRAKVQKLQQALAERRAKRAHGQQQQWGWG